MIQRMIGLYDIRECQPVDIDLARLDPSRPCARPNQRWHAVRDPPAVKSQRGDVEGDAAARFDEVVSARAKDEDRQWQLSAYREICKRHLLPQRATTGEIVGELLEELRPRMDQLEEEAEAFQKDTEARMRKLIAEAKQQAVRDNCATSCAVPSAEDKSEL